MKARLLALAALMLWGASAFAQEDVDPPFTPYFALEIGTGMAPIHTLSADATRGSRLHSELAEQGMRIGGDKSSWCPSMSFSFAWHSALRWEFVLTSGVSWLHHGLIRFDTFGVDPEGKPRYDLTSSHPAGTKDSYLTVALFAQARRFWNPTQKVKLYSAAGFGYVFDPMKEFGVVPSITPIAVRFGTGHLKFFIENTYSPAATALDLGLGWTF